MFRVTFWVQFLFVLLILRQTLPVSDQCSELEKEIFRLERDVTRITEVNHKNELRVRQCHVSGNVSFLHVVNVIQLYVA